MDPQWAGLVAASFNIKAFSDEKCPIGWPSCGQRVKPGAVCGNRIAPPSRLQRPWSTVPLAYREALWIAQMGLMVKRHVDKCG